jgi:uncharacterized protein (DUF488 family)
MKIKKGKSILIYTIGHSTRTLDEFIGLIGAYDIKQLVDIRTIARSRYNPQYNQETFAEFLRTHNVVYLPLLKLGGLRKTRADSPNSGWHNDSFRGFADYMQTPQFEEGLEELIKLSQEKLTVIMCAEAVPWRCHRSLIVDALQVRGIKVKHIIGKAEPKDHELTAWAQVDGTNIIYPEEQLKFKD